MLADLMDSNLNPIEGIAYSHHYADLRTLEEYILLLSSE